MYYLSYDLCWILFSNRSHPPPNNKPTKPAYLALNQGNWPWDSRSQLLGRMLHQSHEKWLSTKWWGEKRCRTTQRQERRGKRHRREREQERESKEAQDSGESKKAKRTWEYRNSPYLPCFLEVDHLNKILLRNKQNNNINDKFCIFCCQKENYSVDLQITCICPNKRWPFKTQ